MTNRNQSEMTFPLCKRRVVEANFTGGHLTSDAGVLLLSETDRRLGLMKSVARRLGDTRRQASCRHEALSMACQRVYGLALGL